MAFLYADHFLLGKFITESLNWFARGKHLVWKIEEKAAKS
jgi:hypothetical protein